MEQEQRKKNYFAFDKNEKAVLVCTDVASRGLDFKGVAWIVQWDLSSNIKEYVNRVGRTARIAAEGSALSFVMPDELEYAKYLKKKYQIELHEKNRIAILKIFETKFQEVNSNLKYKFRKLVNIEANVDEQQESLHAIRQKLTSIMLDETTGLKEMGQTARSSSTRAYAGHSAEMRHIFDMKKLNLTEYARSFGLYKQLYFVMQKDKQIAIANKKKGIEKHDPTSSLKSIAGLTPHLTADINLLEKTIKDNQNMFSRRIQKSKIKDLEKNLREAKDPYAAQRVEE